MDKFILTITVDPDGDNFIHYLGEGIFMINIQERDLTLLMSQIAHFFNVFEYKEWTDKLLPNILPNLIEGIKKTEAV